MSIATVAEIIRTHGADRPDQTALVHDGRTVTFGELHRRSSQLANALRALGVGEGDRVVLVDKNSVEYFEIGFALGKLNAVLVGINWRLAPNEITQIINDAVPAAVIVGPGLTDLVERDLDELGAVPRHIAIGGGDGWIDYEELLGAGSANDPGTVAAGDDVAFQVYTSGTTGLPKGVMLTNEGFFGKIAGVSASWRFTDESVAIAVMPMFHIAGCGWGMTTLFHGCPVILHREVDPTPILADIERFGVSHALLVPSVIQLLVEAQAGQNADLSSMRVIVYGASPIAEASLATALEVLGCELIQVYGLTEASGAVTQLDGPDHRPEMLRSCGRPYPWVDVRLVDAEGADVPPGTVGELWIRSPQVMKGYWNNEEATRDAISADGWLKSGDAGYRDEDGFLYLHDRVKDMIVSGGENIYPAEVENALAGHADIADVAVIGVPDARWGEAVKALVVLRTGAVLDATGLIAFARERLGRFKVPKSIDFVDELPRNPSGKAPEDAEAPSAILV